MHRMKIAVVIQAVVLSFAASVFAAPVPSYEFSELGISYPRAINNAGDAVGWGERGDVVRKGVATRFPFHGAGRDINASGDIAVVTDDDQYLQSAIWSRGVLYPLLVENWIAQPSAINDAGVVVGTTGLPVVWGEPGDESPPPQRWLAVSWGKDRAYRILGALAEDHSSQALDINSRGQIVGISWPTIPAPDRPRMSRTVLFENGRVVDLGLPPDTDALTGEAVAINDRGEILVNCLTVDYSIRAYIYSHGKFKDIGRLPTQYFVHATAINNSGDVVGTSQVGADEHGFLYTNGRIYDLNDIADLPPGCILGTADDINDRGEIIGFAFGNFNYQGYRLAPHGKTGR
jgi:probable HAF family extracellular repeat protein